jgi:hypothetical protein
MVVSCEYVLPEHEFTEVPVDKLNVLGGSVAGPSVDDFVLQYVAKIETELPVATSDENDPLSGKPELTKPP